MYKGVETTKTIIVILALLLAGCATTESIERDHAAAAIIQADKEVDEALYQWLYTEKDIDIAYQRLEEAWETSRKARERAKPKSSRVRVFIGFGNWYKDNDSSSEYPYKSSSGHQYKYDLFCNPGDEIRYNSDLGAQIKDSARPEVNIDNGLNPCHTYRGIE